MTASSPPLPPITRITGGVEGIAASYAAVRGLAAAFEAAGVRLRHRLGDDVRTLGDADLVASAVLSPVTFAEAEARLVDATSGIHGLAETWVLCEADAVALRSAVSCFEETDRLVASSFHALDYVAMHEVGQAAPALVVLGAAGTPLWQRLPARTRRRLVDSAEAWVGDHPEAVQHAVDGAGGLLDGLASLTPAAAAVAGLAPTHPRVTDATRDLARLYPAEGTGQVLRRRDLTVASGPTPPRSLAGLLRHLDQTNDLSRPDRLGDQGTIEVQTFRATDGTVRHVVYLPGTDRMATPPWRPGADARDLPADLRAIAQDRTTYAAGIERAMSESGISARDPVLLVGHSLGGIEAASIAARGSGFRVTHVVTAGAPLGVEGRYPAAMHVLSLENRGDLVPLLDGADNPDSREQVTVQFDNDVSSVVGNHEIRRYVRGAAAAEASSDPSIREQLRSLHRSGFLGARGPATSQVFQVTR